MKNILTLITTVFCLIAASGQLEAQNLQFNSAVFYEYGPVSTNAANTTSIIFTGESVVGSNQVLKITSGLANIVTGVSNIGALRINGHSLLAAGSETYLPTGTYEVTFTNATGVGGDVSAFISGVLYDIVP